MTCLNLGRPVALGLLAALLGGCASLPAPPPESPAATLERIAPHTDPAMLGRAEAARVEALLAAPLSMDGAVELVLRQGPTLVAALAQSRADIAQARAAAAPPGLWLGWERMHGAGELAIARTLSVGLFDWLTWPARQREAAPRLDAARLQAAAALVDAVAQARLAWVEAVAAREHARQAARALEAASAGAELARRLLAAGHVGALNGARQQGFEPEARAAMAAAQAAETRQREALVRALGLTDAQAERLQLPDQLPPLPPEPLTLSTLGPAAADARLDLRQAQAALDAATAAEGRAPLGPLADLELSARSESARSSGTHSTAHGIELSAQLDLFGAGARRDALVARSAAAWQQREAVRAGAASQLRDAHAAWLAAWTIARQHREVLLPLRRTVAEQTLLHYNGMLIGLPELLADARAQAQAVQAAVAAEAQFWRADAALQSQLLGRPAATPLLNAAAMPATEAGASH